MLSNLSLIMEFLGNVVTNFIFENFFLARSAGDGKSYSYQ